MNKTKDGKKKNTSVKKKESKVGMRKTEKKNKSMKKIERWGKNRKGK